jgi:hypothetical protein
LRILLLPTEEHGQHKRPCPSQTRQERDTAAQQLRPCRLGFTAGILEICFNRAAQNVLYLIEAVAGDRDIEVEADRFQKPASSRPLAMQINSRFTTEGALTSGAFAC